MVDLHGILDGATLSLIGLSKIIAKFFVVATTKFI
jgi:hypothetical protein